MNRKIKTTIISIILLTIIGINISYAISEKELSTNFFEVNKNELIPGDTLEITIDLSKINYNQFKFALNSNTEIENIYTTELENNIEITEQGNDIIIDIDKEKLNLDKIILYYPISENIELGSKIQFTAQIIIEENEEEKIIDEEQTEIKIAEKNNKNDENQNPEIKDNNNKNDGNQNLESKDNNNQNINNNKQNNSNYMDENNQAKDNQNINSDKVTNYSNKIQSTSIIQTETTTYKGSNNNYLSSIEIEGVTLTSEFNKEKTTYFATVDGLETIVINAETEDSNSKIAIAGTDFKSGENKILISVTAENGDVRYYRIFVTNN